VATNLKVMNSIIMRNYDFVEQPIHFSNFTQRLVSEGLKFLEERKDDRKPFLLMMSWIQVHTVLHTSEEFRGHSKHGSYGDNVEEMDWSVGEIVNGLERLGLLNNTLVYFTSDNGGHLEEKGIHGNQEGGWNGIYRGGKGQGGMEGGIRVPTVAMWKGHIPAGSVVDVPTSQMDIFPTLSEAIWSEPLPSDRIIDGKNIYPLLTEVNTTPPHRFLVHYCGTDLHAVRYVPGNGDDVYKVHYVTPNWLPGTQECQFICPCHGSGVTYHDPPLLYNIARDPSETRPLLLADYGNVMEAVNKAITAHKNSIETVPSQFSVAKLLPRPWLQPCCNFPKCKCTDPLYGK
jgi:arylsulfatase A-like enzyme